MGEEGGDAFVIAVPLTVRAACENAVRSRRSSGPGGRLRNKRQQTVVPVDGVRARCIFMIPLFLRSAIAGKRK